MLEHGIGKFLKKAVTGEGARLTKAEGRGKLYLADAGKKITILQLRANRCSSTATTCWRSSRALKWDITMMRKVAAMMAGGLFNVRFEGTGCWRSPRTTTR